MSSQEEAEKVAEQGSSANESTKTSLLGNVAVNLFLGGSMSKVWDMIEGL